MLLITSRNRSVPERWCIPAGPIDPGEIAAEAATRGTREEAGVIGRLRDPERPLGVWTNADRRSKTSLFVLDVNQELADKWDGSERARKWFTIPEAEQVLQWKPLNLIQLNSLKERLGLKRPDERRLDSLGHHHLSDLSRDGPVGHATNGNDNNNNTNNHDNGVEDEESEHALKGSSFLASGPPVPPLIAATTTTTITTTTAAADPVMLPVKGATEINGFPPAPRLGHLREEDDDEEDEEDDEEEEDEEEEESVNNLIGQGDHPSAYLPPSQGGPQFRHPQAVPQHHPDARAYQS